MHGLARGLAHALTHGLGALAVAGLLLSAAPLGDEESVQGLSVVYVESNVGGASGGHVALRTGSLVYHYQFDGELITLERDEWSALFRRYALLENRPLHLAHLDVSSADVGRLAGHMARLHVEQLLRLDARDRALEDVAWLEALAGRRPLPPLRAVGLLAPGGAETSAGRRLRERIAAELGPDVLARRERELREALSAWALAWDAAPDLERLRELLAEHAAVAALRDGRGVADEVLVEAGEAPLTARERASLVQRQDAFVTSALELLRSARPDRGRALLVTLARVHAIDRSLAEDRLLLLDPFPDDARRVPASALGSPKDLAALAARAQLLLATLRAQMLGEGSAGEAFVGEAAFNLLEECAARRADLLGALRGGEVRDARGRLVPSRGRAPEHVVVAGGDLPAWTAAARREAERRTGALHAECDYDLVDRNCVTELAQALNDAFGDDAARIRAALGGVIGPHRGANFVPFVYFDAVCDELRVAAREDVPSHRQDEMRRLYAEGADPLVYVREANTLSSTVYDQRAADGSFLLFTDDVFWVRPVYGAVNVAWGLGNGLVGLATAPFDDGAQLSSGMRGVLFSLPELGFANIRKGTFADVDGTVDAES
jgi:hypothetical protein